jgi:cytochrome c oxidase subunit 2
MKLWLPAASSSAHEVDYLLIALTLISAAILVLVFGLMLLFAFRYRAGSLIERGELAKKTWRVETGWTVLTLLIFFGLFVWGANLYLRLYQPPENAMVVYVVGKQWMWKVEHAGGQREINALHVPVNQTIDLVMTSEDVIHDFGIPAFRIKHDVLPGRYETLWFRADKPGTYRMYCDRFCGTDHSSMLGEVIVMTGPDYQKWLEQNGTSGTLVAQGRTLFMRYGCSGCHGGHGTVHAPSLNGVYGSPVTLVDGSVVIPEDRYLRD